jgi:hypothetical protein
MEAALGPHPGLLDQEAGGLVIHTQDADTPVPIDHVSLVIRRPDGCTTRFALKRKTSTDSTDFTD